MLEFFAAQEAMQVEQLQVTASPDLRVVRFCLFVLCCCKKGSSDTAKVGRERGIMTTWHSTPNLI